MKVCIAEKPSVARDLAAVLGANQKREGYLEGNGYQVTWTFGHLCTLKEPHEYADAWKQWRLDHLPLIPPRFGIKLIENDGYKRQFRVIEKLVTQADEVINCGDAGQEGELIQRWVLQKAGCTCPVRRLWISSLTIEAIQEGFTKLRPEQDFQSLYEAGLLRAIGDWLLGMNATRLYTLKFGRDRQLRSIGRVQTPTLALIVQRQLDIEAFVPQTYWELKTTYRDTVFSATKGRFYDATEAESFLTKIVNSVFEITGIQAKKGTEAPPRLFDLTSLQVECNKKFAFSADDTLKTIQSLYEKKWTTYPRVDTTYLTEDLYEKAPNILRNLKTHAQWAEPLQAKKLPKSKKVFDNSKVTDHHAIIPTGVQNGVLTAAEQKVYDLITRRFIACFYPDCRFLTTTVLGEAAKVPFKTTGKQISEPGWKTVFEKESNLEESDEEKQTDPEKTLPVFVVGERGAHQPGLAEKQTQPPKPYTEATLLRAMETAGKGVEDEDLREALKENGIGRPSTRANIIETLFKRQYVRKERKNLIPTDLGRELIATIQVDVLKSVELTGLWEKKLRQIERKEYDPALFLEEMKGLVRKVIHEVQQK
ncbi:MAG: DNA topoisomerase 3 [Bacteroidales bacterium]|jgi:DNA topoisomerase-3|nr:DNA topoisomerase 3 [Bacteroidales bacterium]MDD3165888.1 DNA topoisomerase 3 [Bacteroidales bacterium]MDD4770844.1 DNA topoisomerase 3 [Bacteroidales bacterium]